MATQKTKAAAPTVKKASVKKGVKKVTQPIKKVLTIKKSGGSKKTSGPELISASNDQSFWVNNGPILNNLAALHEALLSMNNEQYAFHAKGEQNHFSLWVESILLDKACAKALKKARTQKDAAKVVSDALKKYR